MRVLWLPTVLRGAGLTVHEVPGWRTRGDDSYGPIRGITCHHTAGSRTSTDAGEIRTLLNGSSSAPPPIAQLYLSRTGAWHVVASGTCFHNRVGWDGPNKGFGNDNLLGIEAQHSGGDEPWTAAQYDSYVRGVTALVTHQAPGWDVTVGRVAGHKEHQPGAKTDPSFDMTSFRARVRDQITHPEDEVKDEDRTKIAQETAALLSPTLAQILLAARQVGAGVLAGRQKADAANAADAERDALLASLIGKVDDEVYAQLRAGSPAATAAVLRAVLGDQAAAIGRILAGAPTS